MNARHPSIILPSSGFHPIVRPRVSGQSGGTGVRSYPSPHLASHMLGIRRCPSPPLASHMFGFLFDHVSMAGLMANGRQFSEKRTIEGLTITGLART